MTGLLNPLLRPVLGPLLRPLIGAGASGVVTPSARSIVAQNYIGPAVNFSRASTATYMGGDGLLHTAAVDQPRFQYGTDGSYQGLMVEESRTNLLLQSARMETWALNAGATAVGGAAIAPDGTMSMALVSGSTSVNCGIYKSSATASVAAGENRVSSVFAKYGSGTPSLRVSLEGAAFASPIFAIFNTSTGAFLSGSSGVVYTVTPLSNGVYRFSVTGTTTGAGSVNHAFYSGTAAAFGTYMWGAQGESGAFPTSYIPTSTSAVTRSADVAVITDLTKIGFAPAGTIVEAGNTLPATGVTGTPCMFTVCTSIGVASDLYQIRLESSSKLRVLELDANVIKVDGTTTETFGANAPVKAAYAYDSSHVTAYIDGVNVISSNAATDIYAKLTALLIGSQPSSTSYWNGTIKSLTYYPTKLPDATLQALTS